MSYIPEFLLDSILSEEVLNSYPEDWKVHSGDASVRHLLKARFHLEGIYKVAKINHKTANVALSNALPGPQTLERLAKLEKGNKELIRSHSELRAAELDIYHEIENINERSQRKYSFRISIVAVIVSVAALLGALMAPNINDIAKKVYNKNFIEVFLGSHEDKIVNKILSTVSKKNDEVLVEFKKEIVVDLENDHRRLKDEIKAVKKKFNSIRDSINIKKPKLNN